jgi:hypothetical protein
LPIAHPANTKSDNTAIPQKGKSDTSPSIQPIDATRPGNSIKRVLPEATEKSSGFCGMAIRVVAMSIAFELPAGLVMIHLVDTGHNDLC